MNISGLVVDLPLYIVGSGKECMMLDAEQGKHLCLFTELIFAERLRGNEPVLGVMEMPQLVKIVEIFDGTRLAGVCFDLEQTPEGPKTRFAVRWNEFKEDVLREAGLIDG